MVGKTWYFIPTPQYYWVIGELSVNIKKTNIKNDVCLHSERIASLYAILSSSHVYYAGLKVAATVRIVL